MKTWSSFEDYIRDLAGYIFAGDCKPGRVGGVDIDGVITSDDDVRVLIEITVRKDLQKTRDDITKLVTAKNTLVAQNIMSRLFCVIEGSVTNAMLEAAAPHNIKVLSASNFAKIFFDFNQYSTARNTKAFGSAVDPVTGVKDDSTYISVTYVDENTGQHVNVSDIAEMLLKNNRVVLLGEYGTGKSRCLRELFKEVANQNTKTRCYPIALDLREAWGLIRGQEIIRRHIDDLGIDMKFQSSFIRALNSGTLTILLDGFDEIGSQAWSNDTDKLRAIRARSLIGVKDLLAKTSSGIFISGREHYFNNNEEMFCALGLDPSSTKILRCKNEFTDEETEQFFARTDVNVAVPTWLPRRPLVCQTIANLSSEELDEMFGVGENEISFFDHFMSVLCKRDARINAAFDASTIERVLLHLAQMTRGKPANVGPVTLAEVQNAFESVVGQMPVDESANMLQRLPALGRVKAESNDRQFIDEYILDGLRAKNIIASMRDGFKAGSKLLSQKVSNPLGDLGQRILSIDIQEK